EILYYAGLLHHIGAFLTLTNYQKHSAYLIRNAELLGFDQTDTALIAETVLYHRNALPQKKHPSFASLTAAEQHTVRLLSLFLRLAENLDRGQSGAILEARISAAGSGPAHLELTPAHDYQVELWGLNGQLTSFERVFNRRLVIDVAKHGVLEPAKNI